MIRPGTYTGEIYRRRRSEVYAGCIIIRPNATGLEVVDQIFQIDYRIGTGAGWAIVADRPVHLCNRIGVDRDHYRYSIAFATVLHPAYPDGLGAGTGSSAGIIVKAAGQRCSRTSTGIGIVEVISG